MQSCQSCTPAGRVCAHWMAYTSFKDGKLSLERAVRLVFVQTGHLGTVIIAKHTDATVPHVPLRKYHNYYTMPSETQLRRLGARWARPEPCREQLMASTARIVHRLHQRPRSR